MSQIALAKKNKMCVRGNKNIFNKLVFLINEASQSDYCRVI